MALIKTKIDRTFMLELPFSTRHIDEFLGLKCMPEIIKFYPDSKEITEAMGVFSGIRKVHDVYPSIMGDPNVLCIVPGDGVSPRVGALAAYRTRWTVHSVDPAMRQREHGIERLTLHTKKIEDCEFGYAPTVVIMSCHSHVELDTVLYTVKRYADTPPIKFIVIALQCCVPMRIANKLPIYEYRDVGIFSPENLIRIWEWNE
jgi:hypothetical protein